jgi:hypothetical protein
MFTDNGQIPTSAGASAGLDRCLHVVERDCGVAVAADAARLAVAPLQRNGGQAQFVLRNRPTYRTSTLEKALAWIEENVHHPLTPRGHRDRGRYEQPRSRLALPRRNRPEPDPVAHRRPRPAHAGAPRDHRPHCRPHRHPGRVPSPSNFRAQFTQTWASTPVPTGNLPAITPVSSGRRRPGRAAPGRSRAGEPEPRNRTSSDRSAPRAACRLWGRRRASAGQGDDGRAAVFAWFVSPMVCHSRSARWWCWWARS